MPALAKTAVRWAVQGILEATYGAGGSIALSNGIHVVDKPDVMIDWAFKGERRGKSPGSAAKLANTTRTGKFAKGKLIMEPSGFGADYTATNLPNIHTPLRFAGMDAAIITTAGSTSVTYTPTADGSYASGSLIVSHRGQQYGQINGVFANGFNLAADAGKLPHIEFDWSGFFPYASGLPTDVSFPSVTYPCATIVPPVARAMTITLGLYAPIRVKSFDLKMDRKLHARVFDASAGQHGGFWPGIDRVVKLSMVVEMDTLATVAPWNTATTINPYQLADLQSSLALSLTVGATTLNKYTIAAGQAQLTGTPEKEEGSIGLWNLEFDLQPSGLATNDEFSILFN